MPIAFFLLNVALNHESEVISKIKAVLANINSLNFDIQGVFGIYDVVVKAESSDENVLRRTAIESIRSIENIQSAITMFVNDE